MEFIRTIGATTILFGLVVATPSIGAEAAPAGAKPEPQTAAEAEPAAKEDPNAVQASIDRDKVTLTAKQAPRLQVLRKVGELAGFEIVHGNLIPAKLDLKISGEPVVETIAKISQDVPYWLEYQYDKASASHKLKRVLIGDKATRRAFFADLRAAAKDRKAAEAAIAAKTENAAGEPKAKQ